MSTSSELTEMLQRKWSTYIKGTENSPAISHMLEAQDKELRRLREETVGPGKDAVDFFVKHFGDSWDEHILRAYSKALCESQLLDLFPPQPMTGPIGTVAWLQPSLSMPEDPVTEESSAIPEIRLDLKTDSVTGKVQNFGNILCPVADLTSILPESQQRMVMETYFAEIVHRKIQTLVGQLKHHAGTQLEFTPAPGETLHDAVIHLSYTVHKYSQRGPANRVACNPVSQRKIVNNQRWDIFADATFPKDEVLGWYRGASLLDQPLIWAPYVLYFRYGEVERMGENEEPVQVPVMRAAWRDDTKMVAPQHVARLRIK